MAMLEKVYDCLTCKAPIKLERKPDNSGWIRYNLDGTPHIDQKNETAAATTTTSTSPRNGPSKRNCSNKGTAPSPSKKVKPLRAEIAKVVGDMGKCKITSFL